MRRKRSKASPVLLLCAGALVWGSCSDDRSLDLANDTQLRVLVAQPDEYEVNVQQLLPLQAFLYRADGEPASHETVEFELLNNDPDGNPGGATLTALSVSTNVDGRASVDLHVGSVGEIDLTVEVHAAGSTSRYIVVHVTNYPVGNLALSYAYEGPVQVGPVDLFVMDGEYRCPYNAVRVPLGEVAHAQVQRAGEQVTFGAFLEGETFTVFARGMVQADGMRTLGAQGCLEGLVIPGDTTLQATVHMSLVPLNPVGTFDVQNHFDFTDAIPGTVGDVVRNLDALFNDTGNYFFDTIQLGIEAAAEALLGGLIGAILGRAINWVIDEFIQPFGAAWIDEWLANSAPDWLQNFFTIGQDLLQIVNNLEVMSLMTFDKVASDFQLSGETTWSGIALYWRLGCEDDAPPECGRHEFMIEQLLDTEYPLEVIWARFGARVVPYNGLKIEAHDVNLQYGRLILFVLNEMLLPRIADGARSITEALSNAFDCPDLALSMTGDDGVWGFTLPGWAGGGSFGVQAGTIESWCEGAATLIGSLASGLIEGLAADSKLTLSGECKLYEDNQDVLVDRLEMGSWSGNIRVGGDSGPQFTGDFRGCRRLGQVDPAATFTERCPLPAPAALP